jgi:hypothetical protein
VDDGEFEYLVGGVSSIHMESLPEEKQWAITSALERHLGGAFDSLVGDVITEVTGIWIGEDGHCEAIVKFKQVT